jgi:Tol biopolymer transport system component
MSPEQAKGRPVDRRADIWAFGAVLYEMLVGRRAFGGDDISDVLASVLKTDPAWTALPDDVPASVRRLLRRCLEKDPQKRLSAIADARLELDDAMAPQAGERVTHVATKRSPLAFAWPALAGILITAAIAAAMWPRATPAAAPLQRLTILPPPGASIVPDSNAVALSPDGTMVTFVVGDPGRSDAQLWVRSLDSTTARRLDDGDGATLPFWSPDSRQIGFFTGRQLKAIPAAGGRAQVIADVAGGRGAAWGPSNVIVYAGDVNGPLFKIPASGGTPVQITTLDAGRKERGHRFPSFLPDGEHFLYAALPAREGHFDIFAGSLNGDAPVRIGVLDTAPVYAAPGYLLYARQGVLTAQPFDVKTLKFTGDPISLEDEPATVLNPITSLTAARPVTLAANGSLAYFSTASNRSIAAWYDAAGRRTGTLTVPPGHYESVNISPDGTHAVFVRSASPSESSLWVMDLARGIVSPLSSRPGRNYSPVWSPDSSQVLFASDRDGAVDFMIKGIADTTPERVFYQSNAIFKNPTDWSRAARAIVFAQIDPGTGLNVYRLPEDGTGAPVPLVVGPTRDTLGHVSPDGRWLAYGSDDTGRYQVYVQPFGRPGRRVQVSQDGAIYHGWMTDGRGLLFASDTLQAVMRADISGTDNPIASAPRLVVTLPANVEFADVTPDGQRFLAILPEHTGIGSITVVQNWRAALLHRSQR